MTLETLFLGSNFAREFFANRGSLTALGRMNAHDLRAQRYLAAIPQASSSSSSSSNLPPMCWAVRRTSLHVEELLPVPPTTTTDSLDGITGLSFTKIPVAEMKE